MSTNFTNIPGSLGGGGGGGGGTVTGTGAANQIAVWSDTNVIGGSNTLTFDGDVFASQGSQIQLQELTLYKNGDGDFRFSIDGTDTLGINNLSNELLLQQGSFDGGNNASVTSISFFNSPGGSGLIYSDGGFGGSIGSGSVITFGFSGTISLAVKGDNTTVIGDLYTTGHLGIGNSASATVVGTLSKKMEVFDASGNSLGFVPIYATIT